MIVKSGIGKPGDVKDWKVSHKGKDITGSLLSATVFQNIFMPVWSCDLQVNDANNLLISAKLDVGDTIKIKVETSFGSKTDGKAEFEFVIIKISGRHFENAYQQTYRIECVDKAFIENNKTRVIRGWKDKPEHTIVSDILQMMGGSISKKDESKNKLKVIIPNFSPFAAISLMCKTATSEDGNDFMFYQLNEKGEFAFRSVAKMYKEEAGVTLRMAPAQQTQEIGDFDLMCNYFNYIIDDVDQLRNDSAGFNGSKLIQYDFINKCTVTTGENDLNVVFSPKHQGSGATIPELASGWFQARRDTFKKLEEYRMIVQLHGGAKFVEWLGKSIKVMVPSQQDRDESQKVYDKELKGKWLIAGITHIMGHQNYAINLELLKIEKGGE